MEVVDKVMVRGDDLVFDVFAKKPDPQTGVLVAVNLTAGKAYFTAKRSITVADEVADIRLGSAAPLAGVTIVVPTAGQVRIDVPPLATKGFQNDDVTLAYDVEVVEASGQVTTVQRGTLVVSPDVTRATT